MRATSKRDRPKLRVRRVMAGALHVYRRHWASLWAAALIVYVPIALAAELLRAVASPVAVLDKVVEPSFELLMFLVGDVVYAGMVAAAVMAWRTGGRPESAWVVLRQLPWRVLIVLDITLPVVTIVLLLPGIVPGLVFFACTVLAAPLAELEHLGARKAVRRSIALVRGSFWRVVGVLLVVAVLAGVLKQGLMELVPTFAGDLVVRIALDVLFAPLYGLAVVLMALDLRGGVPGGDPAAAVKTA